jgi:hypothetical protein
MHSLDINLQPSKQFIVLILLVLLGTLAVVFSLPVSGWIKGLLMIAILYYGLSILWTTGFIKGPYSIKGLRLRLDGSGILYCSPQPPEGIITGESIVTTYVCVLCFTMLGKPNKRTCILFNDSLEKDVYRQLLVMLKCCARKISE